MTSEKKSSKQFTPPTDQDIAVYAYYLWEADGRPAGRDVDHWLQAKALLTADRQYEAGLLSTRPASRITTAESTDENGKARRKKSETPRATTPRQPAFV